MPTYLKTIGWICAGLIGTAVPYPLVAQAQSQTVAPTPLLDAIAGKRPVVTAPLIQVNTVRTPKLRPRSPIETDPNEDANDPQDLIPDEAPAEPFAGDNDPVVAGQESLELDNSGQVDGIYQCSYEVAGKTLNAYVSVNGKGNGQSIFLIANLADNSARVSGWGIGQVIAVEGLGYAFVGNTDNQLPFELAIVVNEQGQALAEGSVGFDVGGTMMLAEITCRSVW
jgi:hypothetical protein